MEKEYYIKMTNLAWKHAEKVSGTKSQSSYNDFIAGFEAAYKILNKKQLRSKRDVGQ